MNARRSEGRIRRPAVCAGYRRSLEIDCRARRAFHVRVLRELIQLSQFVAWNTEAGRVLAEKERVGRSLRPDERLDVDRHQRRFT